MTLLKLQNVEEQLKNSVNHPLKNYQISKINNKDGQHSSNWFSERPYWSEETDKFPKVKRHSLLSV